MSLPKTYPIQESLEEIKSLIKKIKPYLYPRIQMLYIEKVNEGTGISKIKLSQLLGVSKASIQTWRQNYKKEGLLGLLRYEKTSHKKALLSDYHALIKSRLEDPENKLVGYKELQYWIEAETKEVFGYQNVYNYCVQHFQSKIKVARKSHIKKDESKVEAFKKTSVAYVK
jgi:transposase